MARRISTRGVHKDRVYTLRMCARLIGVSEATLRRWTNDGLRIITDRRPYLIRGADLIAFLEKRKAANKTPVAKGQFYCMSCRAPRAPKCGSIAYKPTTELTGRLSGLCDDCGGNVGQFCNAANGAKYGPSTANALNART